MILGFSTQINGKPTFFVEKIHKSFRIKEVNMQAGIDPKLHYPEGYNFLAKDKSLPKVHTIRTDLNDRWKKGNKIDFFVNVRKKDMFRFAPVLHVVSIQNIEILWYRENCNAFPDHRYTYNKRNVRIYVDGLALKIDQIEILSQNDGFSNLEDFFEYFNTDFKGKIIHWTDLKY
ncbi:MAG: hypothetical protein REI96_06220 [Flavobacterium nitrogenifigens]|uniref:hypothetical protein n=1 Tax=Flavobacterium nitrogenifigens TaxID=1617283 RepID=UPI0028072DDE|nr:hypothetical protein [Flavobacterium nitrogenifigens]MDQ8012022.1 hypothetical protein [Flavobacterium nitrogenifigens]